MMNRSTSVGVPPVPNPMVVSESIQGIQVFDTLFRDGGGYPDLEIEQEIDREREDLRPYYEAGLLSVEDSWWLLHHTIPLTLLIAKVYEGQSVPLS